MSDNKQTQAQMISDFEKKAKKFAQEVEDSQSERSVLAPKASDILANIQKNINEVVIGDRVYTIKKFGIRETITLIPILGNVIAVPISALVNESGEMDMSQLTDTLHHLFREMSGNRMFDLLGLILNSTYIGNKQVDLEEDFDDIVDVIKVIIRVFEVNFQVFTKHPELSKLVVWGQKLRQLASQ